MTALFTLQLVLSLDFFRTGLVITLAAVVLLVIFSLTYWPWRAT